MRIDKSTLSVARLIHIYVSMALLTLLLFFSVTGITLNHPEWFAKNQADIKEMTYQIDSTLLQNTPLSPRQLVKVTEVIESTLGMSLSRAAIESTADDVFFSVKKAGENTAITLDLLSGELFFERTDYGWWALMNDLHKGRNTSNFWLWIIDLTSVLCIIFAISGFILAMPQRRFTRTLSLSLGVSALLILFTLLFA